VWFNGTRWRVGSESKNIHETKSHLLLFVHVVQVNAVTGEIVSVEKETPADQKKEKKRVAKSLAWQ
jgi:hypothetical protein